MVEKRQLINADELSQMLGIRRDSVYRFVAQRRLPFVKIGRALRFDLDEINKFIKEKSIAAKDFY
ncbi:MAG: helix-turn-helix domain-containing protein [Candidatus Omnitrophica bacterium]|nr:helix-turn-helix domain-containing protein [Candidatus Omnitrophota bacterium]